MGFNSKLSKTVARWHWLVNIDGNIEPTEYRHTEEAVKKLYGDKVIKPIEETEKLCEI
jgi:hypothetical protein